MIVPTLCVGMQPRTLCVPKHDAERRRRRYHAERGNDLSNYNPPVAWKLTPITVSNDNGNSSVSSNALAGRSTPG